MLLGAEGHDRINVANNPVNLIDPYGLFDTADAIRLARWAPFVIPAAPILAGAVEGAAIVGIAGTIVLVTPSSTAGPEDDMIPIPPYLEAKGGKQNVGDTGLAHIPDAEISRRARDKTLSPEERRRYQKEEKARRIRNRRKRCQ